MPDNGLMTDAWIGQIVNPSATGQTSHDISRG
jgi:hypothetical protein